MTNEKRFKLTTEEDICYCEYTYWKGDEPLEMEEVVDVLNELSDENEQLHQKNTKLIAKIDFLERVIDGDINE
jgi:hypothetical protein